VRRRISRKTRNRSHGRTVVGAALYVEVSALIVRSIKLGNTLRAGIATGKVR
jgi:hypothetical protein